MKISVESPFTPGLRKTREHFVCLLSLSPAPHPQAMPALPGLVSPCLGL